jgi:hypothetical protein
MPMVDLSRFEEKGVEGKGKKRRKDKLIFPS